MSENTKRLYRSTDQRMLAGVCGGLGKYFDLDPTLVRIAFVVLALVSFGIGLIAYIALAIVMPVEPVPTLGGATAAGAELPAEAAMPMAAPPAEPMPGEVAATPREEPPPG
jgi:phage shock protein PspC (stress-responsive transcriptional regulator)